MKTLAVIALKGGSGKTTVATHLALAAHLRGVDTLIVDTDPQYSARDILSAREAPGPACTTSTGRNVMAAQFGALAQRRDLLIIDTPAGAVETVSEALVVADLAVMVVRPTLIDIAGLARTLMLVRRLGKPSIVVVNQAPVARENVEAPLVKRALKGLDYMQAPLAPVILRSRSIYQTALERGARRRRCRTGPPSPRSRRCGTSSRPGWRRARTKPRRYDPGEVWSSAQFGITC